MEKEGSRGVESETAEGEKDIISVNCETKSHPQNAEYKPEHFSTMSQCIPSN